MSSQLSNPVAASSREIMAPFWRLLVSLLIALGLVIGTLALLDTNPALPTVSASAGDARRLRPDATLAHNTGWDVRRELAVQLRHGYPNLGPAEYVLENASAPPTSVTIDGPDSVIFNTPNLFTATVSPISATLPFTYVWQATGQSPVTHRGVGLRDTASFNWQMTDTQTISVTAINAFGTVSAMKIIEIVPFGDLVISGPATGTINTGYVFTASVMPPTAMEPITYLWQATGQSPLTHTVNSQRDVVSFVWTVTGPQLITVTATNSTGTISNTKTVAIIFVPLSDVTIGGPTMGLPIIAHTFTAAVSPLSATQPISYVWQATGQSAVIHARNEASDAVTFSWSSTGPQTVTVTAINPGSAVSGMHLINIESSLRYVATTGTDLNNDCHDSSRPCATIQHAVDVAEAGYEIRVAGGTYTDMHPWFDLRQVVYLDKSVIIRGGYSTDDWTTPNPQTNPTILDAQRQGRVFLIRQSSPTLIGLRIIHGRADWQGGGVNIFNGGATLIDNVISENYGRLCGAGVYLLNTTGALSGNTIRGNTISRNQLDKQLPASGAGICLDGDSSTLSGNTVSDNDGGGIYLYRTSAKLIGNTISGNNSKDGGGIVDAVNSATAIISGNVIIGNTAGLTGGGGLVSSTDATWNGNLILNNTASNDGGGMRVTNDHALLVNNIILNNAASFGGGIYAYSSNALLVNNIIADNRASAQGNGIYITASTPRLIHNTVARNSGGDGSGIYVATPYPCCGSNVALINSIIVSHVVGVNVALSSTVTLNGVLWFGNGANTRGAGSLSITNEIIGDPAFAADGYHLTAGSAAIDKGIDAGVTTDIDGQARPNGSAPDLGADEFYALDRKTYLPILLR